MNRDYILDFIISAEKKRINLIIKQEADSLLSEDEEIQMLLQRYKSENYHICTYTSGVGDIYKTIDQIIKNYLKNALK